MRIRMQKGVGKACEGGGEIEKRLAGNTTRNSDTRYTQKRKKATKIQKGKPNLPVYIEYEKNKKK